MSPKGSVDGRVGAGAGVAAGTVHGDTYNPVLPVGAGCDAAGLAGGNAAPTSNRSIKSAPADGAGAGTGTGAGAEVVSVPTVGLLSQEHIQC
jgi:hypothetical protein